MKCQNCQCIVTQAEADEAHEIRPDDQDTLCPDCAKSLNEADAEEMASRKRDDSRAAN